MTRDNILKEFTANINKYKQFAYNVAGKEDAEDLFQLVALMVLEFSEERLISYYHPTHGLKPIFLRMCCNQYRSTTSVFHKLYRKQEQDLRKKSEDILLNTPKSEEQIEDEFFNKIDKASREIYNNSPSPEVGALLQTIWLLYIEMKSLRKTLKPCHLNIKTLLPLR